MHWTQWVPNKLLKNVQTLQKPSVRYGHATTSTGHQVVIHGGYNNKNQPTWMDDLWLFHRCSTSNEWEWTSVKGDGVQLIPEARYSHTLINLNAPKDMKSTTAAATTLYLFGGDDGGHRHAGELMTDSKSGYKWGQYFNDVWRVDIVVHGDHLFKAKWMKMKTRSSLSEPSPRTSHSAVAMTHMESKRMVMVVFGGLTVARDVASSSSSSSLMRPTLVDSNEVWWMIPSLSSLSDDNTARWKRWKQQNSATRGGGSVITSPEARHGHAATTSHHTMYIFGGQSHLRQSLLSDLWSWTAAGWSLLHKNKDDSSSGDDKRQDKMVPNGLLYAAMSNMRTGSVDSNEGERLILHGGAFGCHPRCTTESTVWLWEIGTNVWTKGQVKKKTQVHVRGDIANIGERKDDGMVVAGRSSQYHVKESKSMVPMHRYRHTMSSLLLLQGDASSSSVADSSAEKWLHVMFGGESYGAAEKYHNDLWFLEVMSASSKRTLKLLKGRGVEESSVDVFRVVGMLWSFVAVSFACVLCVGGARAAWKLIQKCCRKKTSLYFIKKKTKKVAVSNCVH